MSEKPKGKPGPKPKPPEQLSERMLFTFPRELAEEVREWIPAGERSALVQQCLSRAIQAKKRKAAQPSEE